MASSSSPPPFDKPHQEKYDVFLSFRGEDTRDTFTSHLYAALLRNKIETYIDYKLERGDRIGTALLEAIEKSKLSVVIFSKDYASSTWCLNELVHILGCKEKYGHTVIPVFYDIDPSQVRKQQGSYAHSFFQHEERFKDNMDKVRKWRDALKEAADMSGFDSSKKAGTDADFIGKVVEDILAKMNRKSSCDLKGLVGIEKKIEQIESLLCIGSLDVYIVCIWGMGGIGKTTLADAVFHGLSSKFEGCCFLANVREQAETRGGVMDLRNKLLRKLLNDEKIDIDTPSIGSTFRQRLNRTKALIVLDDVSDSSQLEVLFGDHLLYAPGSRIIITTRDRGLLEGKVDNDKIYKVEGLSSDEALQLFLLHALKNKPVTTDYAVLSRKVVDYVKGIPLALKTLGPVFLRHKRKEDWEQELDKLKKFPSEKIQNVLRHSYNGLEENEKEIFLDVACFFKGMGIDSAKRMLDTQGFFAGGIEVLIDKSLLSISTSNCLDMHDLLHEMGLAIVREQCIEEPGKRSRLYTAADVYHVLENNTGTATVQCISFPLSEIRDPHGSVAALKKMYNLRYLCIWEQSANYYQNEGDEKLHLSEGLESLYYLRYLSWEFYPLKSLPSRFSPKNLVELRLPFSKVEAQLWNEDQLQNLGSLKVIDLSDCVHLTEVPDLSQSPKIEHINLYGCTRLVGIPSYFQYLDKLTHLDLGRCKSLKYIPDMPGNIEFLSVGGSGIKELPSSVWSHEKISSLDIEYCESLENLPSGSCKLKVSGTFSLKGCKSLGKFSELPRDISVLDLSWKTIEVLPSSIERLLRLTTINLKECKRLVSLPTSICKLKSLEVLDLTGCSSFEYFPDVLEPMEHLEFLSLEGTVVKDLPSSIVNLIGLQTLRLHGCVELEIVPDSIYNLTNLKTLSFYGCSKLKRLPSASVGLLSLEVLNLSYSGILEMPDGLLCLTSLRDLDLSETKIVSIPASVKQASQLSRLCLINCLKLQFLPELPLILSSLEAEGCTSLKKVSSSRTALTQDWDEYKYLPGPCVQLVFSKCHNLDKSACGNIMADAQLRIMRVATLCYVKQQQRQQQESSDRPLVSIVCPGDKIPNWFRYANYEGCSINIKLPSDWFREGFLGFALSVVAPFVHSIHVYSNVKIKWKYNFKTDNGESHEIEYPLHLPHLNKQYNQLVFFETLHVFVWYNAAFELVEGVNSKRSSAFFKLVTEASVDFYVRDYITGSKLEVQECGISLLYTEDTEITKLEATESNKKRRI